MNKTRRKIALAYVSLTMLGSVASYWFYDQLKPMVSRDTVATESTVACVAWVILWATKPAD